MKHYRTYVNVNLPAIAHNIKEIKKNIPKKARIMAIVKANGYGHGDIQVLKFAVINGVHWAGVSGIDEAIKLRKVGFNIPILLLNVFFQNDIPYLYKYDITPVVYSFEIAQMLNTYARKFYCPIKVHIKVDTGMGRIGFSGKQLYDFIANSSNHDSLIIDGIMSHFSSADEGEHSFTISQLEKFTQLSQFLQSKFPLSWIHIANSAGSTELKQDRGNLFRTGISMYGQIPSRHLLNPPNLQEAITFKSSIIQIKHHPQGSPISYGRSYITQKESLIATISVGYGDGYSRHLSNNGYVLIKGKRASIVGKICMDMTMIDVTDIPKVELWDEVVLIGKQGDEYISATEIAAWIGTINYEVTCNISKRVPRYYTKT